MSKQQQDLCKKYGSPFVETSRGSIAGIARNLESRTASLNGLRHPPVENTSGWFIWAGDYSEADDFFEPIHVGHLDEVCPEAIRFLGLAPGWRFLIAGDHVDVWYDASLLDL
jgi:hypothetical protein